MESPLANVMPLELAVADSSLLVSESSGGMPLRRVISTEREEGGTAFDLEHQA